MTQDRTKDRRTENCKFSDLWIEWSGTGGTFTMHRNGGRPVFPVTEHELDWLDQQIAWIFDTKHYSLKKATKEIGLAFGGRAY